MGLTKRRNPTSPRAVKKNNRLWESHLRRRAAGKLEEKRLSPERQKALAAIAHMEAGKANAKVKSVREVPANKILGPRFKGKKLVTSMRFELPDGRHLDLRLLKSNDAPKLWDMYYNGMSPTSRGLFASSPIFTGTTTPESMRQRLSDLNVGAAPHGKKLRGINRGKFPSAFNPKFPTNPKEVKNGAKPKFFDPSANYVVTDPKTGRVEGFFQVKYLAGQPIFGAALRDEHHGKGLGVLGTRFRLDVARRLGLKSVRATVNPKNVSKIVLEKQGFKVIGETTVHKGLPTEHVEELLEYKFE